MDYDAAIARRMIRNDARRRAQGWGEVRDLGGALALTSETPVAGLNCLRGFKTTDHDVESLLDIGFALLRAFDREPAVVITPLDRPKSLAKRLQRRRMRVAEVGSWMRFAGDAGAFTVNPIVEVRVADPEDAREFARVVAGGEAWARKPAYTTTVEAMLDARRNTFYLGCINGETIATLHMLVDARTAGIYAVNTVRAHRRKGISTTLLRRAILDAQAMRADVVCLSTAAGGYAQSLYERLGFGVMFESQCWTGSGAL